MLTSEQQDRMDQFAAFREESRAAVEQLAVSCGWFVDRVSHAGTGSLYIELHRNGELTDEDGDEVSVSDSLIVRIADHGTCYDREDYTLQPDGMGHTLDQIAEGLRRPLGSWDR